MAYGKPINRNEDEQSLNAEEMDALRAALASILMQTGDIAPDEVYSLVFSDGARLTWH
jgi:hypothetical protein